MRDLPCRQALSSGGPLEALETEKPEITMQQVAAVSSYCWPILRTLTAQDQYASGRMVFVLLGLHTLEQFICQISRCSILLLLLRQRTWFSLSPVVLRSSQWSH